VQEKTYDGTDTATLIGTATLIAWSRRGCEPGDKQCDGFLRGSNAGTNKPWLWRILHPRPGYRQLYAGSTDLTATIDPAPVTVVRVFRQQQAL